MCLLIGNAFAGIKIAGAWHKSFCWRAFPWTWRFRQRISNFQTVVLSFYQKSVPDLLCITLFFSTESQTFRVKCKLQAILQQLPVSGGPNQLQTFWPWTSCQYQSIMQDTIGVNRIYRWKPCLGSLKLWSLWLCQQLACSWLWSLLAWQTQSTYTS